MLCEECEEREAERDAIVDGLPVRLCSRCASMTPGIVVEKPSQIQVDESKRMWRVKEILSRSAGIPYNKPAEAPKLQGNILDKLRPVNREKKSIYQTRAEEREKAMQKAKEGQAQKVIEESKDIKESVELIDE